MTANQQQHASSYAAESYHHNEQNSERHDHEHMEELSRFANRRDEKPARHQSADTADHYLPRFQDLPSAGKAAQKHDVSRASADAHVREEQTSDGRRVTIGSNDGRTEQIEYDRSGKAVRYKNFHGETFENRGPDQSDPTAKTSDVWHSTSNTMQPRGVHISIDASNSVTVQDRATNNTVTTSSNGVEVTAFAGNQGTITRKSHGNEEWVMSEGSTRTKDDPAQAIRTMHIVDNKLRSYTDSQGTTYTKTEQLMPENDGDPYSRRPVYQATDASGHQVSGTYTVSADRTGNVVVRNEDHADDPNYARRELANGTVITSNRANTVRRVTTADGLQVETRSSGDHVVTQKTITYPNGGSLDVHYQNGVPTHVSGVLNGTRVDYTASSSSRISERNAQIAIDDGPHTVTVIRQDGTIANHQGGFAEARDPEAGPSPIQQTPPGVDVARNVEAAHMQPNEQPADPGAQAGIFVYGAMDHAQWFKAQVNYGGVWDFKSPMSRSRDAQGHEVVTNDQMRMSEYEAYGNWHYGVVGRAAGFSQTELEEEAGAGQVNIGTSRPEWGSPGYEIPFVKMHVLGTGTYGDDPQDNQNIVRGYADEPRYEQIA